MEAGAVAAKPQRGFIITLRVTTPNEHGADTIESFNNALKAINPTPERPLQVLQAKIAHQTRIGNDPTRMAAFAAEWARKQAEKAAAAQQAVTGGGGSVGGGRGGGGGLSAPPGEPGGFQGARGGGYAPPPAFGGNSGLGGLGGGGGGANPQTLPEEAYQDPVLKEDMRNDTECIVVMAVAVDPAAPAATTPKTAAPGPAMPVGGPPPNLSQFQSR
jgi:hypothetical protein